MSEAILLSYNNSEEVEKDVKALLEASAIEYEVKSMDEVGLPTFKVARDDGKTEIYRGLTQIDEALSNRDFNDLTRF